MSFMGHDDHLHDDEHHCDHCLTSLDRWAASCYRCSASFEGHERYHLIPGKPHLASVLHHG